MNHLLLAGAQDVQTAADAFIAGDFHGAFTYYLCASGRAAQRSKSAKEVHQDTVDALREGGYSQLPQIEGIHQDEPLYGDGAPPAEPSPVVHPGVSTVESSFLDTLLQTAARPSGGGQTDRLERFLTVSEKFLDLSARLLDTAEARGALPGAGRAVQEVYVAVHGISRQLRGYSDEWFHALCPHLRQPLDREEVLWSHHVNARSLTRSESSELQRLQEEIARVFEQRSAEWVMTAKNRSATGTLPDQAAASRFARSFALDDFVRYMVHEPTREAILDECTDTTLNFVCAHGSYFKPANRW